MCIFAGGQKNINAVDYLCKHKSSFLSLFHLGAFM